MPAFSQEIKAIRSPEIVAPLGQPGHLAAAVAGGAHAVYVGLKGHSSRPDAASFSIDELKGLIPKIHKAGLRCYLAINAEMRDAAGVTACKLLRDADALHPDAIILGDLGMLALAKQEGLRAPLHASSLLGVLNAETIITLRKYDIRRVILPTCLTLPELAELIESSPTMDFEIIAYNGVCFNDSWRCGLAHCHSPAGGFDVQCTHSFSLMTEGQSFQPGGHLLWTQDIDASGILPLLWSLGVVSFKIEGRTQRPEVIEEAVRRLRRSLDELATPTDHNRYQYLVHSSYLDGAKGRLW